MKYWLLLFLLTGCKTDPQFIEPAFSKNETVVYKVPSFLRTVCSGLGTIKSLRCLYGPPEAVRCPYNSIQVLIYYIETPAPEQNCPSKVEVEEADITRVPQL